MKKQLLNLSAVFAAMFLISSVSFAQLTKPVETFSFPAIENWATTPIVLDGVIDEDCWSDAQSVGELFSSPADFGGESDLSAVYYACWNNVGIYIAFKVQDNEAHNFDGVNGNSYQFDNVELFFNMDTAGISASGLYAPDGIQLRYCRGLATSDGMPAFGSGEAAKDTAYKVVPTEYALDDQGASWSVEILVPWGYIVPSAMKPEDIHDYVQAQKAAIGFDVSVADSDGKDAKAGARDAQLAWDADSVGVNNDEDNAWQDVRKFGVISLAGTPGTSVATTSATGVEVYPNVTSNVVNFRNLNGVNSIEIVNLLGQTVKTVDVSGRDVVVNVSDLASGNYFAIVKSATTTESIKFIVK